MFLLYVSIHKATPNKFLDSHPNFVKNWGGWEVLIFYFSDCFETMLEDTLNTLKLSCQKEVNDEYKVSN